MAINLMELLENGALQAAESIKFNTAQNVGKYKIVLYLGDDFFEDASDLSCFNKGDNVFLLDNDTVRDFRMPDLRAIEPYEIICVKRRESRIDKYMPSYVGLNKEQARSFRSIGLEELVMVKADDILRVFSFAFE